MSFLNALRAAFGRPRAESDMGIPISLSDTVDEAPIDPLTPRDRDRLRGVHPDLVRVVERARGYAAFIVGEGVRSLEKQRQEILAGRSRIPLAKAHTGRHVTGHAVDLYPINGKQVADMPREDYAEVVAAMKRAAAELGVEMKHGYDWPWDSPHHELAADRYPAG